MWKDITDQPRAVSILQRQIIHRRVAHAYLFAGPVGAGKREAAIQMAKVLFCASPLDGDSCEQCIDCQRIHHENHPDVHVLEADGASIKIEQIRALRREFQYQAVEAQRKVYIILDADTMTIPAANSLLKFLEEPQGEVTAILITSKPNSILPTIRSRCQIVTFQEIPWQHVAEAAIEEGIAIADARLAAHIAKHVEEVRALCAREEFAQLRKIVIQFYQEDFRQKAKVLLQLHNKVLLDARLKDEAPLFLELSVLWLRDILHLRLEREQEVANIDAMPILKQLAAQMTEAAVADKIEIVLQAQNRLKWMNTQLALEQMVMELADVHMRHL